MQLSIYSNQMDVAVGENLLRIVYMELSQLSLSLTFSVSHTHTSKCIKTI